MVSECERLVSSPLLVLSWEILGNQVAATLILKSIHPFKWRAQFEELHPHKSIFPFTFQITHFCSICLFLLWIGAISSLWCPLSFAGLIFNFNRCKLVVLVVLVTVAMGINAICCVLEFLCMGLLFLMGFYVSLTWFLCSWLSSWMGKESWSNSKGAYSCSNSYWIITCSYHIPIMFLGSH